MLKEVSGETAFLVCNSVGYLCCCSANHTVVLAVVLCLVHNDKEGCDDGFNIK